MAHQTLTRLLRLCPTKRIPQFLPYRLKETQVSKVSTSILKVNKDLAENNESTHEITEHEKPATDIIEDTIEDYREDIPPFMRNVFLGKFPGNILSYSDILDNDRYFKLKEKCDTIREGLSKKSDLIKSINKDKEINEEIIQTLKEVKAFGLRGSRLYGGQNLSFTESLKIIEEFSYNMSLSEFITGANTYAVNSIALCGTNTQKSSFLPKLYSGESIGAVCLADDHCGMDISSTKTSLKKLTDRDFVLNGKKTWVVNGASADIFTVFANLVSKDKKTGELAPSLTACVVEKKSPGITIGDRVETIGMKGLDIRSVNFDNVTVPLSNIIGEPGYGHEVYNEMMQKDRVYTGARICSLLREVMNYALSHTRTRVAFGKTIEEFDLVKHRLAVMTTHIYALESMTYLTAGLADVQKEVDIDLEASMTKLYALNAAKVVISEAKHLLGSKAFLESEHLNQIATDIEALEMWEGQTDLLNMVIGISGISEFGKEFSSTISRLRNVHLFPKYFWDLIRFRKILFNLEVRNLPLKLNNHVHPSLAKQANFLEASVLRLKFATKAVMVDHGHNAVMKEIDMWRLSLAATEIYAMASTLARANRSYCKGYSHSSHEVEIALKKTYEGYRYVYDLMYMTGKGFYSNNDFFTKKISEYVNSQGVYSPEHPTLRHVF